MADKKYVMLVIGDLVTDFLYYDRKEDEDLPRDEIQRLVASGKITVDDMVGAFRKHLEVGLK